MTTDPDQDGPAAFTAIALRRRLRSLVVGAASLGLTALVGALVA